VKVRLRTAEIGRTARHPTLIATRILSAPNLGGGGSHAGACSDMICRCSPPAAKQCRQGARYQYERAASCKRFPRDDDALTGGQAAWPLVVKSGSGINEHARHSDRRLAESGLREACSRHVWRGQSGGAPSKRDPHALDGERTNLPLMQARFDAARDFLRTQPNVDPTGIVRSAMLRWRGCAGDGARGGEFARSGECSRPCSDTAAPAEAAR